MKVHPRICKTRNINRDRLYLDYISQPALSTHTFTAIKCTKGGIYIVLLVLERIALVSAVQFFAISREKILYPRAGCHAFF